MFISQAAALLTGFTRRYCVLSALYSQANASSPALMYIHKNKQLRRPSKVTDNIMGPGFRKQAGLWNLCASKCDLCHAGDGLGRRACLCRCLRAAFRAPALRLAALVSGAESSTSHRIWLMGPSSESRTCPLCLRKALLILSSPPPK